MVFRFHCAAERWEWPAGVEVMHGYSPGTAAPTTELVLLPPHPEDRQYVAATLDEVGRHRQAVSTRHRIVDTAGRVDHVIVVADTLTDETSAVVGTQGFYVAVSPAADREQQGVSEAP